MEAATSFSAGEQLFNLVNKQIDSLGGATHTVEESSSSCVFPWWTDF